MPQVSSSLNLAWLTPLLKNLTLNIVIATRSSAMHGPYFSTKSSKLPFPASSTVLLTWSLSSLKSTRMPTATLLTWLSEFIFKKILLCPCFNASKYDINVIHHAVTHLDPDICTEVEANYPGHLDNIPWDALSKNCALQKPLVISSQYKVKVCSMRNLIAKLYFPEEFPIFCYFPVQPRGTTLPYATRT